MTEPEAGRELDALIAEKVMGLVLSYPELEDLWDEPLVVIDGVTDWAEEYDLPRYSTDLTAAWRVVEKMADSERGWWRFDQFGWGWHVYWNSPHTRADKALPIAAVRAETFPLAICQVALLVVALQRREPT